MKAGKDLHQVQPWSIPTMPTNPVPHLHGLWTPPGMVTLHHLGQPVPIPDHISFGELFPNIQQTHFFLNTYPGFYHLRLPVKNPTLKSFYWGNISFHSCLPFSHTSLSHIQSSYPWNRLIWRNNLILCYCQPSLQSPYRLLPWRQSLSAWCWPPYLSFSVFQEFSVLLKNQGQDLSAWTRCTVQLERRVSSGVVWTIPPRSWAGNLGKWWYNSAHELAQGAGGRVRPEPFAVPTFLLMSEAFAVGVATTKGFKTEQEDPSKFL